MAEKRTPPLEQMNPDVAVTLTPRQVMEAIARGSGRVIASYHKEFHTPWWKRAAMRVAAETQSFKEAVNEESGAKFARGEMGWQKLGRRLRPLAFWKRAAPAPVEDVAPETATVRHIDRRAGRGGPNG
jgi:hypothetical protein